MSCRISSSCSNYHSSKDTDSRHILHHFFPTLTWAVSGNIDLQGDTPSNYLERALIKSKTDETNVNRVRSVLKHFFRKRAAFVLGETAEFKLGQSAVSEDYK